MVFSVFILAVSLSLDALGVGLVYGLRQIKIPLIPKIVICLLSILYSGFALMIGKSLAYFIPPFGAKLIGVSILTLMGLWIILQALLKRRDEDKRSNLNKKADKTLFKVVIKSLGITVQVVRNPTKGDIDESGVIDIFEALLLGLALSVDAIGVGIGSALTGFHSMIIPFAVGLFQLGFLFIGTYLGEKVAPVGKINKKFFSLVPGILMISLAIARIC